MSNGDVSRYRARMASAEEELQQLRERLDEISKRAAETDRRIDARLRSIDETIALVKRVRRRLEARR